MKSDGTKVPVIIELNERKQWTYFDNQKQWAYDLLKEIRTSFNDDSEPTENDKIAILNWLYNKN